MPINSDNAVGLALFQFELLRNCEGLTHGISTRAAPLRPRFPQIPTPNMVEWEIGGSPKREAWLAEQPESLIQGRRLEFLAALGLEPEQASLNLTSGQQRHTANVAIVSTEAYGAALNRQRSLPNIDAVVTNQVGVPLLSTHADCLPLVLFDPVQRVVATIHSGWRGTAAKIAQATVRAMQNHYHSQPADILAGIGPGIGPCCYAVGEPVLSEVEHSFGEVAASTLLLQHEDDTDVGQWYFDLWAANQLLFLEAGLQPQHIESSQLCTHCHADTFFSYRATGEARREAFGYGLFGSMIALTS
jgi:YfiH family protein